MDRPVIRPTEWCVGMLGSMHDVLRRLKLMLLCFAVVLTERERLVS